MRLIFNSKELPIFNDGSVVTIGNFDGVHLGHQALLKQLSEKRDHLKIPMVVILFEPQPSEFFLKEHAPVRLTSLREKIEKLKKFNPDIIYCLKFNNQLASMPPEQFASNYIFSLLNARYLIVGSDFRFGFKRQGDILLLEKIANKHNCEVENFQDIVFDNKRISSTQIRNDLKNGNIENIHKSLGEPFWLCSRVIKGARRGHQWGIPTANFKLQRLNLPLEGVFCVKVINEAEKWTKPGVANIGTRPTVDGLQSLLEVHLLDEDISLYGERLKIIFLHKLRDEIKFSSIDKLIEQVNKDITNTRNYFRVNND